MVVLSAVSAVLLHQTAMDICNDCSDVITEWRVNLGSDCSLCGTVTSKCYE
jgi:hypothetical protein